MKGDAELMLAKLRRAILQIRLLEAEFEEIGIALRFRMITAEVARAWVHAIDADSWLPPPQEMLEILPDKDGGPR
jgi:hypothetical protein